MLRDEGEMEDVRSQWGSLAGRALPSGDGIFLFFSRAALGGKGQPSDPEHWAPPARSGLSPALACLPALVRNSICKDFLWPGL